MKEYGKKIFNYEIRHKTIDEAAEFVKTVSRKVQPQKIRISSFSSFFSLHDASGIVLNYVMISQTALN